MTLIFRRNFDDELDRETRKDADVCSCNHPSPEELEARIEEAKSTAFQAGQEAGRSKALEEFQQQADQVHNEMLTQIKEQLSKLFEKSDAHIATLEAQILDFGLSVCDQVFPYLLHHQSHERALTQIKKTMRIALNSPCINITISKTAMPHLKPLIEQAGEVLGLADRIKLSSDTNLADGSTHIEWKNGFMEYSFDAVCERILAALKAAQETSSNLLENESETNG